MDDEDNRRFEGLGFAGFDFFFKDMTRQMEELTRHMDEMFKDTDGIHIDFHPPHMSSRAPPLRDDPRALMLEDPYPSRNHQFGTLSPPYTPRTPMMTWNDQNKNTTFFPGGESHFTSRMRSVQTVRNADGSVEKIEKTMENGRTCTTVTKTDPHGNSTTTTTCDKPAIEAGPSLLKTSSDRTDSKSTPDQQPGISSPSNDIKIPNVSKEDQGFFANLFKKYW